jgi:hypothetical protein
MSLEKLVASIEAKGSAGIKKADLRREFQEADIDSMLEELVRTQEIFIEKKGTSFYCWHKNYYLQNLLNEDQKFSLIYSSINTLGNSLISKYDSANTKLDFLTKKVSGIENEIRNLAGSEGKKMSTRDPSQEEQQIATTRQINYDTFKEQLDYAITNNSSSMGWVELSELRKNLCAKLDISREDFYQSIHEIISNNYDKYELSTGGKEGIQLRGLVHGFVRCI